MKDHSINVGKATNSKGFNCKLDASQKRQVHPILNQRRLPIPNRSWNHLSNREYELGYMEGDGLPSPETPPVPTFCDTSRSVHSLIPAMQVSMKTEISWFKVVKRSRNHTADATPVSGQNLYRQRYSKMGNGLGNTTYKELTCRHRTLRLPRYQPISDGYGLQGVTGINKLTSTIRKMPISKAKRTCDYFLENGNYLKLITSRWDGHLN